MSYTDPDIPQPDQEEPQAPPPASVPEDVQSQLSRLQSQLSELEHKASSGALTRAPVDEELTQRVKQAREEYKDWPSSGDEYKDKPQPYELQKLGLPQPGVNRDFLPAGEPNTLTPIVVGHHEPTLQPGDAGQPVARLAGLLATAGYPTTISRGTNHTFAFEDSLASALEAFKRDYHVIEDSSGFRSAEEAARVAGPWVWEALRRVAEVV